MTEEPLEDVIEGASQPARSGRGFLMGFVIGTVAGVAAAALFAPAPDEGAQEHLIEPEPQPEVDGSPADRVRAVLQRVRQRVHEAKAAGREAAQEAERATRARYEQLTHPNGGTAYRR